MTPSAALTVLDNNVVLDWLVFQDPHGAAVGAAVESRGLHWISTEAMHAELGHVLGRGLGARWSYDALEVTRRARQWSVDHVASVPTGPLRSRDPDDQKFIDLALALQARWLLSRDLALLRLAGKARAFGLEIVTPSQWRQRQA